MKVDHWHAEDGPLTEQALRNKLQRPGYSVSRYVYPPGTYFPDHVHAIDKIDAVITGQLRIAMGDNSVILKAGDFIQVPRVHSAEVIGDEPAVSLDAVRLRSRPFPHLGGSGSCNCPGAILEDFCPDARKEARVAPAVVNEWLISKNYSAKAPAHTFPRI